MKYVYIIGLEHSGTTLLAHLLGQAENVVALGEVAQFFSVDHMRGYISKWGKYPDVRLCSCGADWEECEFWSRFYYLCGLVSDAPIADKYKEFLGHLQKDDNAQVFIDSSKVLGSFQGLWDDRYSTEFSKSWLFVLFCIKDARSFVSSISKKHGSVSLVRMLRTYNWWNGHNQEILDRLQRSDIRFHTVLYEQLCFDTKNILENINHDLGLKKMDTSFDLAHNRSHIVLGNKDFISRNREAINYDYSWFLDDRVAAGYLLHGPARRLNKKIYKL